MNTIKILGQNKTMLDGHLQVEVTRITHFFF